MHFQSLGTMKLAETSHTSWAKPRVLLARLFPLKLDTNIFKNEQFEKKNILPGPTFSRILLLFVLHQGPTHFVLSYHLERQSVLFECCGI